jgi:hypothetical protein
MSRLMPRHSWIQPNHPCWSCAIDPALALSPYGVPLVKQLGEAITLWVGRELWHILNNPNVYLQQPELVIPKSIASERKSDEESAALEETLRSLREWKKVRLETDLAGLNLFWIGDSLSESFIPKGKNLDNFWRWESFASSLDERLDQSKIANSVLTLAVRDTAALAASLESTFILTYQNSKDFAINLPPDICKALENWGIPCQVLTPQDSIFALERNYLHQLLISAGVAKLLWTELHLAVLHLVVPGTSAIGISLYSSQAMQSSPIENSAVNLELNKNLWTGAYGFWYQL